MSPPSVAVDSPIFDSHLQVALVERDHEVQTIAPEAAGEPLTYRVGPGRPVRSSKNSHSGYRVVKSLCSAVCIMNIAWRRRPLNGRLLFLETTIHPSDGLQRIRHGHSPLLGTIYD